MHHCFETTSFGAGPGGCCFCGGVASHLGLRASIYALNVTFSYRKRYIVQLRGQKALCGEFYEFATMWDFCPRGTGSPRLITPKNFGESYRVAMGQE